MNDFYYNLFMINLLKFVNKKKKIIILIVLVFSTVYNIKFIFINNELFQESKNFIDNKFYLFLQKTSNTKSLKVNKQIEINTSSLLRYLQQINRPRNYSYYSKQYKIFYNNYNALIPLWQQALNIDKLKVVHDAVQNKTLKFSNALIDKTKKKLFLDNIFDDYDFATEKDFYFLVVILQVRLYKEDRLKWSINELKQWMHYLFLAGVEHIYICNHSTKPSEDFSEEIRKYINLKLVTLINWGKIRNPMKAQISCYQRHIRIYKNHHYWQMAIDIDEYPFMPTDLEENFLSRFLEKFDNDVGEISMANFIMLGKGNRSARTVIERIHLMTSEPSNLLSKPIYRPAFVRSAAVHHNHLAKGKYLNVPYNQLRMIHYWGSRDEKWSHVEEKNYEYDKNEYKDPELLFDKNLEENEKFHLDKGDKKEFVNKFYNIENYKSNNISRKSTIPKNVFDSLVLYRLVEKSWAKRLKDSLICFEEADAINNSTGP